jgi:hypothetical protein
MIMKKIITIVSIILFTINLIAQEPNAIIYRDFMPDTVTSFPRFWSGGEWPGDTLCLDINSDSNCDIMFYFGYSIGHYTSPYINVFNSSNSYICTAKSDKLLNDSSLVWKNSRRFWNYTADSTENFGFKHVEGSNTYYGWFRGYITYDDSLKYMYVDKMAYCTTPNYPLIWGQTSTNGISIKDTSDSSLELNYNNNTGKVLVYYPKGIIDEVEIINSSGQLLNKISNINADNTEIDVSNYKSGMYIVRAIFANKTVVSAKFVK